jgi:hypothetical protein
MNAQKCIKCKKESTWTDYTNQSFCETPLLRTNRKKNKKKPKNKKRNKHKKQKQEYYVKENKENTHLIMKHFIERIFRKSNKNNKKKQIAK